MLKSFVAMSEQLTGRLRLIGLGVLMAMSRELTGQLYRFSHARSFPKIYRLGI